VNPAIEQVAELLRRETGIHFAPGRYSALRTALARAMPGDDALDFLGAATDPVRGRAVVAALVDEVTVQETSFFRDRRQLDAIPWRLLLERAQSAGSEEIRVWSAACATGEEAYTLALLAATAFAPVEPPVRILGTDISNAALGRAHAGRYRERSVRAVEPMLRRRCFEDDAGRLAVGERTRQLVRFTQHNLARDPIPPLGESAFDLILCRNVLIYFDGETVERVIDGLEHALRPDGMLILGSADALCGTTRRLARSGAKAAATVAGRGMPRVFRRPLGRADAEPSPPDLLDAEAYFLKGVGDLEEGDAPAAAASLRRALYVDPTFSLAAFTLGRAHEAAGDPVAARRAYEQALRTIDLDDERHDHLLEQVELEDVATACRVRLAALD